MRIAVVGSPTSWYFEDLSRAAGDRHELVSIPYAEIAATVGQSDSDGVCSGSVRSCAAAILRSMPAGSLEQIIFRMDVLQQAEAGGVYMVNAPRSMEAAIDKFLASSRLASAGLATPRTHVSQQWQTAVEAFHRLGGDVVIKPLFGGEGRGITRVSDADLAERAFKMLTQMGAVVYQQQYIPHHGSDVRVLVLGDQMWAMQRHNGNDWRTNVSRGAVARPMEITDQYADLARRAADAVGAVFAGVDILKGQDGTDYVLEVNAVPGWKALSQTLEVDIAAQLLTHIETATGRAS